MSRSALIQRVLERYFEEEPADIGRRIAEGYQRIPQGTPDEWGDLEAQLAENTVRMLQRLDQEERELGLDPW